MSQLLRFFFFAWFISGVAIAQDIEIKGTTLQPIRHIKTQRFSTAVVTQQIPLLKLELSEKAQFAIGERLLKTLHETMTSSNAIERRIELGMNGVPVLDQGHHGTCVTFAISAAIDAILQKGDYISQLCQLELGHYLEANTYTPSGWDGSWGRTVLNQVEMFGVVSKHTQEERGCSGLKEYPIMGVDPLEELTVAEHHLLSEPISPYQMVWTSILDVDDNIDEVDANELILSVKKALHDGDRLTFGVLLLNFQQGVIGAVGTHRVKYDSWILTPEIVDGINDQTEFAGHEMVITGYDDDAVATDDKGRKYRGFFTLRNSWGSAVGDQGNFYMSYGYFKALALEIQRIRHIV